MLQTVDRLVSNGADVDAYSPEGMTPLSIAAFWGYPKMAKYLVEHRCVNSNCCNLNTLIVMLLQCFLSLTL